MTNKAAEIPEPAMRAAKLWFRETRQLIEVRRPETGGSFADAANASLSLAEIKLATIIASEYTRTGSTSADVLKAAIAIVEQSLNADDALAKLQTLLDAVSEAATKSAATRDRPADLSAEQDQGQAGTDLALSTGQIPKDSLKSAAPPCKWCAQGDTPKVLDRDGTLVSITHEAGTLSHAYEEYWWSCSRWGVELHSDPITQATGGPQTQHVPDHSPASLPDESADSPTPTESEEAQKLYQAIGWICDAADAAYNEDSNNERIHEIFNIAAKAAGLTRRLPDEHGTFEL